jgi:hypothetical protein
MSLTDIFANMFGAAWSWLVGDLFVGLSWSSESKGLLWLDPAAAASFPSAKGWSVLEGEVVFSSISIKLKLKLSSLLILNQ